MTERGRAIVFDVDEASLVSLRQAFSEWQVEVSDRATIDLLIGGHSLGVVDLLVLGVGANVAESLGLCRVLRKQPGSAHTPILMLVAPGEDSLVRAALEAGATSCLVLPVHVKELANMVTRAREANQVGTLFISTAPRNRTVGVTTAAKVSVFPARYKRDETIVWPGYFTVSDEGVHDGSVSVRTAGGSLHRGLAVLVPHAQPGMGLWPQRYLRLAARGTPGLNLPLRCY